MKLFVAFRQNGLFDQYVAPLLEGLPIHSTFTIPAGVALAGRKVEFAQAVQKAAADGVAGFVTDNTCSLSMYKELTGKELPHSLEKCQYNCANLNHLFRTETEKLNDGATVAENLVWFAEQVADNKPVTKIVVVADCISDHQFAGTGKTPGGTDELAEWVRSFLAGRFNADCIVVGTLKEALELPDAQDLMIVADRHCGIKDVMSRGNGWYSSLANWPRQSMLYTLPFETCAAQLIDRGTINRQFDIAAMRAELVKQTKLQV